MMSQILKINQDSKVMDLATGSAGFLISAMELMIEDAEKISGKDTSKTEAKITHIKKKKKSALRCGAKCRNVCPRHYEYDFTRRWLKPNRKGKHL